MSASSVTLGPSLGEKVDAADRDHTECQSLWLLPRRGSCELTARKRGQVKGEGGDNDFRELWEQTAGKEVYGTSSLLRTARTHPCGRDKGVAVGYERLPEHDNMSYLRTPKRLKDYLLQFVSV